MSEIYLPDCQRVCMPGARVALSDALEIMTEEWIVGGQYADQTVIDLRDATATLLARHAALVEAVAWLCDIDDAWRVSCNRETDDAWVESQTTFAAARAEVDRLIASQGSADCQGEG